MRCNIVLVLVLVLALAGCGKKEPTIRHYQEVAKAPDVSQAASAPLESPADASALKLAWTAPEGWTEEPSSGMRLATFGVGDTECTIVTFPGDSGGVLANLERWCGQLKVEVPEEKLAAFAQAPGTFSSAGGFDVSVFDFAALLPQDSQTSMLAAIVRVGGQTVFVKLMGNTSLLSAEKSNFIALCKSIRAAPSAGAGLDRT